MHQHHVDEVHAIRNECMSAKHLKVGCRLNVRYSTVFWLAVILAIPRNERMHVLCVFCPDWIHTFTFWCGHIVRCSDRSFRTVIRFIVARRLGRFQFIVHATTMPINSQSFHVVDRQTHTRNYGQRHAASAICRIRGHFSVQKDLSESEIRWSFFALRIRYAIIKKLWKNDTFYPEHFWYLK